MTNGILSTDFSVSKATGQGCPFSPSLFAIALVILANKVLKDKQISGIKIQGEEYKLKCFADDVVLTIMQLQRVIRQLMKTIKGFGEFSGYKITHKNQR